MVAAPVTVAAPVVEDGEVVLADFLEGADASVDLDPFNDAADSEPFDVDDVDDQAQLDLEPTRVVPAAAPKRKYKPGTRQEELAARDASTELAWWARPDADFAKEADRMRHGKSIKVPGENYVISMNGAGFR